MKRLIIWLIQKYQRHISPALPPSCKYTPTCSQYAIDALETRGLFVGVFLAVFRVLRCNPLSKGGYDPVPQKKKGY